MREFFLMVLNSLLHKIGPIVLRCDLRFVFLLGLREAFTVGEIFTHERLLLF